MAAELSTAWWSKHKAKTLISEPLSAALKLYDKAEAARRAEPNQEHYDDVHTALKAVEQAAAATKKKCNPSLHKETMGHVDELVKRVAVEEKLITDHYAQMKSYLGAAHVAVKDYQAHWLTFKASKAAADFVPFVKSIAELDKFVENFAETRFYAGPLGQLHQKAHGLFDLSKQAVPLVAKTSRSAAEQQKLGGMETEFDTGESNLKGWLDKMKPPH